MNIPTTLAEQLKLYLKQRSNNGDLEAKTLLVQIQQLPNSPSPTVQQQAMDVAPAEGFALGC